MRAVSQAGLAGKIRGKNVGTPHATIAQLFTKETLLNGQAYTIIEQRHVLLGNSIFYRLRLQPEQGQEVKIDIPIETNKPAQLGLEDEQAV